MVTNHRPSLIRKVFQGSVHVTKQNRYQTGLNLCRLHLFLEMFLIFRCLKVVAKNVPKILFFITYFLTVNHNLLLDLPFRIFFMLYILFSVSTVIVPINKTNENHVHKYHFPLHF